MSNSHLFPSSPPSPTAPTRPTSSAANRYYASNSAKPFSKSAAKRSSVMALGSIAHLQHFYVKNGLANPERVAGKKFSRSPLVLALPGAQPSSYLSPLDDFDDLPPSPAVPDPKPVVPFIELKEPVRRDAREARIEVLGSLEEVCRIWGLVEHVKLARRPSTDSMRVRSPSPTPHSPTRASLNLPSTPSQEPFILTLLHTTTSAIRAVQKYVLSLPSESLQAIQDSPSVRDSLLEVERARNERFSSSMGISTSARSRSMMIQPSGGRLSLGLASPSSANVGRRSFTPGQLGSVKEGEKEEKKEDALTTLRRSSLDVLGSLKDMEMRYRLPGQEDEGLLKEEDEEEVEEARSSGSGSGSGEGKGKGYMYRTDVALEDLQKEAEVVRRYVELVDHVLFRDAEGKKKRKSVLPPSPSSGSTKKGRRQGSLLASFGLSETGITEEPEDEEGEGPGPQIEVTKAPEQEEEGSSEEIEVPDWAAANYTNDPLRRAHTVLAAYLSARVIFHLSPPFGDGSRDSFLDSLHDGTLLCLAYNSALRKSQRPWGFIQPHSIHDLFSAQEPSIGGGHSKEGSEKEGSEKDRERTKVGMTFRKIENLRVWAAALKLRYLVNLTPPPAPKEKDKDAPIVAPPPAFEPKVVARKEQGWEDMLEHAVLRWVHALVEETRAEGLA
ncbi:hypothetical protein BT69DRAFT_1019874 [Atractiella rhizophila]|nr:hypothetical protein BT69DRAFT_1019874 [Atractiella rhizophila]